MKEPRLGLVAVPKRLNLSLCPPPWFVLKTRCSVGCPVLYVVPTLTGADLLPCVVIELRNVLIRVWTLVGSAEHLGTPRGWTHAMPRNWCDLGRHGDGLSGGTGVLVRTGPTSTKLVPDPLVVLVSSSPRLLQLLTFYDLWDCMEHTRAT